MKLIDTLHRWTGGLIGLLLALLGLSGALLVHKNAWTLAPHAGDPRVEDVRQLAQVTQRIMADPAARPLSISYASDDFGLLKLLFEGGGGAYADQRGAVVTRWGSQWERPELWLFDFHHHLFSGEAGDWAIGIAALCGLFFVVTGLILWWRTRRTFEWRLWPARMSRPAIVRHHRDLGVIVAPLLLLSLVTGAVLVFRPMAALLFGPGAPAQIEKALAPLPPRDAKLAAQLDWAGMVMAAKARFPDAELRGLTLPRKNSGLITIRMRRPQEWLPNGRTTLWFAADSGALVAARDAAALPMAVQGYNLLYPLHTAKVGGLAFKLIMTLSGLAMTLLGTLTVWTFWFRRSARAVRKPPVRPAMT
ncbi:MULTISPECIES: PepSY-associated TM helix domain-containing protein [unclassified Sphingobium]|uniref:PepSY-associated TM helix domain-containing protein n=1 Tax=unclassified Sphingobium TaxID=2611147 RepID=UPI0007700975|nr:PepSY-associated TM helix domain-containing protein [Sphingobium sp. TKS]AMK25318.1 iron-uptake factor [Sphingobium sp. TKS]NML87973.1 PepSY domain-containing protein [Sphingobium sp. TB-6]